MGIAGVGAVLGSFGCPGDDSTTDDGADPGTSGTGDPPETDGSTGDPPSTGPAESSGGPDDGTTGAACSTGADAEIGTNHGHSLFVPIADIEAGMDVTYDITGTSGHMHDVSLTADQLAMLLAGMTVVVTSTEGGAHTHEVTISC